MVRRTQVFLFRVTGPEMEPPATRRSGERDIGFGDSWEAWA